MSCWRDPRDKSALKNLRIAQDETHRLGRSQGEGSAAMGVGAEVGRVSGQTCVGRWQLTRRSMSTRDSRPANVLRLRSYSTVLMCPAPVSIAPFCAASCSTACGARRCCANARTRRWPSPKDAVSDAHTASARFERSRAPRPPRPASPAADTKPCTGALQQHTNADRANAIARRRGRIL